jgi:hypothetical protein
MQTASVPGFIRTILIIVGIYYAFKILARIFMPFLLRKMVQKAEQNFKQQAGNFQQNNTQTSSQQATNQTTPKVKKQIGEYVDFEEIKE